MSMRPQWFAIRIAKIYDGEFHVVHVSHGRAFHIGIKPHRRLDFPIAVPVFPVPVRDGFPCFPGLAGARTGNPIILV